MEQKPKFPYSVLQVSFPEKEGSKIWLFSSLTLQRNLARYKFPAKLSSHETIHVLNTLKKSLEQLSVIKPAAFFSLEQLSAHEKEFLCEHFLYEPSFQNAMNHQGVLMDESGTLLALLNLKNHIQLHMIDLSLDLAKAWNTLSKIENEMAKQLSFAFLPQFGYLTSDPTECGTALKIAIYLHLPALYHSNQLKKALSEQKGESLTAIGLEGSLDELVGDMIILKNQYTLGVNEESIVHELQTAALALIASEQALRKHLKDKENPEIKDQVARAYGLLSYCHQLQTKEALNALSLIKLGLELGWIKGVTSYQIDHTMFQCRRAHLAQNLNHTAYDSHALNQSRACFIHKSLEKMVLL